MLTYSSAYLKFAKKIVDVRICNGQLKTITKWSTIRLNMKGPHISNCPLHMRTSTIVLQILNMCKHLILIKYVHRLLMHMWTSYIHRGLP